MGRLRVIGALGFLGVWALGQSAAEMGSRVLDLGHPSLSQRIDSADGAKFDFVRLTVSQVNNPRRVGLIFGVAFIPDGGSPAQLGGFSLYPPDKPGAFIVSTRHLINSAGVVVVTLNTATHVDPGTPLSVTMGAIEFVHGKK